VLVLYFQHESPSVSSSGGAFFISFQVLGETVE